MIASVKRLYLQRSQKKLKEGASRSSSVSLEGRGAPDTAQEQIPRISEIKLRNHIVLILILVVT